MRQRLIYLLKHNAWIQTVYRVVMSAVFRIWGAFLPTDPHLVLFTSFMGKGCNDSPKVIYDYLQATPAYRALRCVWAFESPEQFPGVTAVKLDTLAYFKTALRAKYWVTNTNIERGLRFKKKDQVYLNTWHGVALKKIGNDCPGRKDYHFDTVDHLVVSGDYDERVFSSAFRADRKTFLRCGMPRNEALWYADEAQKQSARRKLGIPAEKKVILYAPTWRESTDGGKTYVIRPPIHFDRWKEALGAEYVVLFRAHHQTTGVLGVVFDEFVRDVSDDPAVNDLMIAADLLITDYSAIAFDFSILCKPILCYAYDYDSYLAERGTYFAIDERYPEASCRTEEELLEQIRGLDYEAACERTRAFRDAFMQYGAGATQSCVQALFGNTAERGKG